MHQNEKFTLGPTVFKNAHTILTFAHLPPCSCSLSQPSHLLPSIHQPECLSWRACSLPVFSLLPNSCWELLSVTADLSVPRATSPAHCPSETLNQTRTQTDRALTLSPSPVLNETHTKLTSDWERSSHYAVSFVTEMSYKCQIPHWKRAGQDVQGISSKMDSSGAYEIFFIKLHTLKLWDLSFEILSNRH